MCVCHLGPVTSGFFCGFMSRFWRLHESRSKSETTQPAASRKEKKEKTMRSSVLLATLCCASVLGRDWSFKEFFVGEWDMERHTKGAMFALSRWVLTQRTPPNSHVFPPCSLLCHGCSWQGRVCALFAQA